MHVSPPHPKGPNNRNGKSLLRKGRQLPNFRPMKAITLQTLFRNTAFASLFLAVLFLGGCSESRPDLDDPVAVADYLCRKSSEVQQLGQDGETEEALALLAEVQAFEQEVRAHHGEGFGAFNSEMEQQMSENCLLDAPE